MTTPLRLLIIEDSEDDTLLAIAELRKNGYEPQWKRVATRRETETALKTAQWDLVICDYNLPQFNGLDALSVYLSAGNDCPFIIVSGTIGEVAAVEVLRAGAHDYVSKDKLWLLGSSVRRELREAHVRRGRRAAEDALRDSERKYRSVVEQASDGIAIFDPFGNFLEANSRALQMTGYSAGEASTKNIIDIIAADDLAARPMKTPALAPGQSLLSRRQLIRKNGSTFPAEINSTVLDDGRILSIIRDVSEQVRSEEILRHREEQQRAIAEVGRLTASGADIPRLLQVAGQAAAQALRMEYCRIVECCTEPEPHVRFSTGWPRQFETSGVSRAAVLDTAAAGEEPVIEQEDSESLKREWMRSLGIRSGITARLGTVGVPVGLISLHSRMARSFSRDDVVFLQSLASLLGEAIQRKHAEELLRASEKALSEAQAIAKLGSWRWDFATDRISGSAETARLLGLDPQQAEISIERVLPLVSPDSLPRAQELLRQARCGYPAEDVFEVTAVDGVRRVLYARVQPAAHGAFGFVQDVTDRETVAAELLRREQDLARAQHIGHLGNWEWDIETDTITWSVEMFRMFGLDPAAGVPGYAGHLAAFYTEESRQRLDAAVQNTLKTGEPYEIDVELVGAEGRPAKWVAARGEPVRDPSGRIIGLRGTTQDITERKRASDRLAASEQRLRNLIAGTSDAILTLDSSGRAVEVNPAVERLVQLPANVLIGANITDYVHPAHVSHVEQTLARVVATGQSASIDVPVKTAAGEYVHVEATASRQAAPEDAAVFVIARDVTERRRAEAEREALAREIKLLLESTYEGILARDPAGRCTLVNRAACAMLGYTAEELLGNHLHSLIHPRHTDGSAYPVEECPIGAAWVQNVPRRVVDDTLWRKDGTSFPVEVLLSPIVSGSSVKGVVISFTDVTDKRLLHDELERANRLSSLGRVAATISHEFNNVLMGIQPLAEIIGRSDDLVVKDASDRILRAVHRGSTITQELLRFTRPGDPVKQAVDACRCVSDSAAELAGMLPRSVHLRLALGEEPLPISADREQVAQVIGNIVLNARDAIGSRKGEIVIAAKRCGRDEHFAFGVVPESHRFVHLSISDDGPGIPEENLPRIFEPFFTTKKKGIGLGLPIAHQIVTLHGGHIFVDSGPGRGTAFHIFLPAAAKVDEHPTPSKPAPPRHRPKQVLLIEDEETVASAMKMLLEADRMNVEISRTGSEALQYLTAQEPEAIVLDVGLPDINGVELYAQIRERFPSMPIVFSSGYVDRAVIENLARKGPTRLLVKPYEISALLHEIDDLCASVAPHAAAEEVRRD